MKVKEIVKGSNKIVLFIIFIAGIIFSNTSFIQLLSFLAIIWIVATLLDPILFPQITKGKKYVEQLKIFGVVNFLEVLVCVVGYLIGSLI